MEPDVWGLSSIPKLHIKRKERTKFPKLCSAVHTEAHMHTHTYAHSQIHLSKTKEKGRKETPGCCGRKQKMQTFRPLTSLLRHLWSTPNLLLSLIKSLGWKRLHLTHPCSCPAWSKAYSPLGLELVSLPHASNCPLLPAQVPKPLEKKKEGRRALFPSFPSFFPSP